MQDWLPSLVFSVETTKEFDGQEMQCTCEHSFPTFIFFLHLFLSKQKELVRLLLEGEKASPQL